jgi:hypothetical protein
MSRVLPFVICLLMASAVGATVIVPAEFREIVAGSEIIAYMRVVETRPEWADGRRQISTIVTADVLAAYKGDVERSVSFRVPGGQIGRYRSVTVGAPVFKRGDEAVLFLTSGGADVPQVFGLNQGVFRVRQDPRSGRRIVVRPLLTATSDVPQRVVRGTAARRALEIEAFDAQLRLAIGALRAAQGGAR